MGHFITQTDDVAARTGSKRGAISRDWAGRCASIYSGATNAHAWPEFIAGLARWTGASKGLVLTPQNKPNEDGFAFPHGMPQAFLALWAARHLPADLWVQLDDGGCRHS